MNLKNKTKYRDFFGQEVFCTDDVKNYILNLVENQSIAKVTKFYEYLSPFGDIVFPVLVRKNLDDHLFITDSSTPPIIKEIALSPSTNGGTISLFYTDESGYYTEKNYSIETNTLLYINKTIDNIFISVGYTDGPDSSVYAIVRATDELSETSHKYVEASLDDFILLENLEYGFIEETLDAFKNNKFIIRSSSLAFIDIFSHYSDNFSVAITDNGECMKFSTFSDNATKLSAKLLTQEYGISISIVPHDSLDEVKSLYASFLSTNFGIVD